MEGGIVFVIVKFIRLVGYKLKMYILKKIIKLLR